MIIDYFIPEPLIVIKPIKVEQWTRGKTYYATFKEANISSGGETLDEAMRNVAELIACHYEYMTKNEERLGPALKKTLSVLREYIRTN